jgi:hypothetical protein
VIWRDGLWAQPIWSDGLWAGGDSQEGPPPEPEPESAQERPAGGYFTYAGRQRTHRDVQDARSRVGIPQEAQAVIVAVAERQAAQGETDEQKRFEELERELELRGIEWEARYLAAMTEYRELLRQRAEDGYVLVLLAAAASQI